MPQLYLLFNSVHWVNTSIKNLLVNFKGVRMLTQELKILKDQGRASTSPSVHIIRPPKYIHRDSRGTFIEECTKAN